MPGSVSSRTRVYVDFNRCNGEGFSLWRNGGAITKTKASRTREQTMVKDRGLRKVARKMPALLDALNKLERRGGRKTVLEVGCGFGVCLRGVQRRYPSLDVCGMNVRKHVGEPENIGFEMHYGDAGARIPLPDSSVDLIYSYCMISFVEDKLRYLEEAFRCLKPGGCCLLRMPSCTNMRYGEVLLPKGTARHSRVQMRVASSSPGSRGGGRGGGGGGVGGGDGGVGGGGASESGRQLRRPTISLRHFLRYVAATGFDVRRVYPSQVVVITKRSSDVGRDFTFPVRLQSTRRDRDATTVRRFGVVRIERDTNSGVHAIDARRSEAMDVCAPTTPLSLCVGRGQRGVVTGESTPFPLSAVLCSAMVVVLFST